MNGGQRIEEVIGGLEDTRERLMKHVDANLGRIEVVSKDVIKVLEKYNGRELTLNIALALGNVLGNVMASAVKECVDRTGDTLMCLGGFLELSRLISDGVTRAMIGVLMVEGNARESNINI